MDVPTGDLETGRIRGGPDQKATAVFSADQGRTWDEFTVAADDPSGELLWWNQMNTVLPDGRIYTML